MEFDTEVQRVVDAVIRDLESFDLIVDDAARKNSVPGAYVSAHRHEYLRTVSDVLAHCEPGSRPRILEIGAFFGVVSVALARLGCVVTAADIAEFMELPEQIERFRRENVSIASIKLQDYRLPFEDEAFDVVIMCEVLEHLNFNPLPLLKEINRIGRKDSIFYLSQPNHASIGNRIRLLRGDSIQIQIEEFFSQLDPSSPDITNGHWREYTKEDIRGMLEPLGYRIAKQYYFSLGETLPSDSFRRRLSKLAYRVVPSLKENLTTIAVRASRTGIVFHIPSTVHPTLRRF